MKFALVAFATLALVGCTDRGSSAYEISRQTAQATSAKDRPVLRIGTLRGPPNRAVRTMRDALTAALGRRGIETVRRRGPGVIELTGEMSALNEGKVTTYTYEWRLADERGPIGRPVVGFERAPGGSSDAWGGASGNTAARMANRIARRIALMLRKAG